MTTLTKKEREDLSLLLPWYVAGTLDETQMARIDAALETDAALRTELELVLEDQAAALELIEREDIPASMNARFQAALKNAISRSTAAASEKPKTAGLLERLAGFLAPPRRLAFAAAAAALLIVAQGGVILSIVSGAPDSGPGYVTASGDAAGPSDGLLVLARFADGAGTSEVAAWLAANGGRVVDGPLPGGMFKLRFPVNAAADAAALAGAIGAQTEIFAVVLPAQ